MTIEKVFRLSTDTEITSQLIAKLIEAHKPIVRFYEKMDGYYNGKHHVQGSSSSEYSKIIKVISNRVKYIIDIYNGYFIGRPIKLKSEDIELLEVLEDIDRKNVSNQVNRILSKSMAKYGHAFELVFNDEDTNTHYTYLNNKEVIYVYDDTVLERPLFAIHYVNKLDIIKQTNVVCGTIYKKTETIDFAFNGTKVELSEPKEHHFGAVQINEYIENDERTGAIEPLISLQDGYNQAFSDKATGVSYFADSYLKIIGVELEGQDDIDLEDTDTLSESEKELLLYKQAQKISVANELKNNRVIYVPEVSTNVSNPQIEFLSKPSNDTGEENLLNRIKNDMHTISHIPDFKELSFSNTSAEAIRLAMWDLDNVCGEKEDNFKEGLNRRYKLILNMKSELKLTEGEYTHQIDFIFNRNIPQNTTAELDNALKARSFLSQQTVLEMIPSVVTNVNSEIERIKENYQNATEMYDFGVTDGHNHANEEDDK